MFELEAGKSEQIFYVDVRTPLPFGILATIVTVIVIAIALLVILIIKLYKDKVRLIHNQPDLHLIKIILLFRTDRSVRPSSEQKN
jgi:hypothetical protein